MGVISTLPCFDGDEEGDAKSSTTTEQGRTGDFSDGTGDLIGVPLTVSTRHCFDGVSEGDKTCGFVLVCFLGVSVDVTFAVSEIEGFGLWSQK